MKIRTQFIFTLSFFVLILIGMAASLILTNQQVDRLRQQEEIALRIEQEANELNYLSGDYLMYGESQQRARWEARFVSFSADLASLKPANLEQQAIVSHISADQKRLRELFTEVVSTIETSVQNSGGLPDPAFNRVSWSRMEVQNQSIAFEASLLSQRLREQADRLKQLNFALIFILIGIFGAYLLASYYLIYQRTLKSIVELQAGTEVVGSGDLDFSIEVKRADEIGALTSAFNRMAANLKDVTASKADLEREIAERAQAEEALRLSEKKFALAFANNPAAITLTRLEDGVFQDVNDTWVALTGYSRKEAIGFSARKLPIWPTAKAAARFVQELREKGVLHWREQEFRKKSGEVFVAQLSAQLLPIQGELMILSTLVDITERKQAEQALRQAEERFKLALKHAPVSVATQDRDLVYTWAYNQTTRRTDEIVGKTDMDLFPSEATHLTDLKRRVLETGENIREQLWVTSNAQRLFLDLYIEPLRNEIGEIESVGLATVNLTQVRLAEDALRESEATLRETNEELDGFNRAMVGRELRMIELKQEVNQLCESAGQPPRYPLNLEKEEL